MFTKKHYVEIASTLNAAPTSFHESPVFSGVVDLLSIMFKHDNPSFSDSQFRAAVWNYEQGEKK